MMEVPSSLSSSNSRKKLVDYTKQGNHELSCGEATDQQCFVGNRRKAFATIKKKGSYSLRTTSMTALDHRSAFSLSSKGNMFHETMCLVNSFRTDEVTNNDGSDVEHVNFFLRIPGPHERKSRRRRSDQRYSEHTSELRGHSNSAVELLLSKSNF